jgi:tRNA G37 N-methylase Trm5
MNRSRELGCTTLPQPERASVLDYRSTVDGFFRVRNPYKVIEGAAGTLTSELAVFAYD